MTIVRAETLAAPVPCDFCDHYAVAVSTSGEASSRRARCASHRVLGGEHGMVDGIGKRENDWLRSSDMDLDRDVMPRLRARSRG